MSLAIGDQAPQFTLQSDEDIAVSLNDFIGKKVILYFYPKDNTPGCTKQACDFRDAIQQIIHANTVVIGISRDNTTRHAKFKQKYDLPFSLLYDATGNVCEAYQVINKKSLFGNTFLGIERSTFLIDEQGKIRAIWRKVKVPGHIEQLLAKI